MFKAKGIDVLKRIKPYSAQGHYHPNVLINQITLNYNYTALNYSNKTFMCACYLYFCYRFIRLGMSPNP